MTRGTYIRTAWQRKKASKRMKQIWANKRRSIAHKRLVAERKAAGIKVHTNGLPYKNVSNTAYSAPINTLKDVLTNTSPKEMVIRIVIEGNNLNVTQLVPSQQE